VREPMRKKIVSFFVGTVRVAWSDLVMAEERCVWAADRTRSRLSGPPCELPWWAFYVLEQDEFRKPLTKGAGFTSDIHNFLLLEKQIQFSD
jgi:hypothetical protein